jgi:hypothetical protein
MNSGVLPGRPCQVRTAMNGKRNTDLGTVEAFRKNERRIRLRDSDGQAAPLVRSKKSMRAVATSRRALQSFSPCRTSPHRRRHTPSSRTFTASPSKMMSSPSRTRVHPVVSVHRGFWASFPPSSRQVRCRSAGESIQSAIRASHEGARRAEPSAAKDLGLRKPPASLGSARRHRTFARVDESWISWPSKQRERVRRRPIRRQLRGGDAVIPNERIAELRTWGAAGNCVRSLRRTTRDRAREHGAFLSRCAVTPR